MHATIALAHAWAAHIKLWSAHNAYAVYGGGEEEHTVAVDMKAVGRAGGAHCREHDGCDGCARCRAEQARRRPRNLRTRSFFSIVQLSEMEVARNKLHALSLLTLSAYSLCLLSLR